MIFKDKKHEEMYKDLCKRIDCELRCLHAVVYLLTMDDVLREHIDEVYNFRYNGIRSRSLQAKWQTLSSKKTTRLALNLLFDFTAVREHFRPCDTIDETGCCEANPGYFYSPAYFFSGYDTPYYLQAVMLYCGREGVIL